jgi:hypothetical protein
MATKTGHDQKAVTDRISDDVVHIADAGHGPSHGKLVPIQAEAKMRKKIDTRLLPMIILMYIMNYLDRNNIAAVRLAGLQDELNLTSVQYQVGLLPRLIN